MTALPDLQRPQKAEKFLPLPRKIIARISISIIDMAFRKSSYYKLICRHRQRPRRPRRFPVARNPTVASRSGTIKSSGVLFYNRGNFSRAGEYVEGNEFSAVISSVRLNLRLKDALKRGNPENLFCGTLNSESRQRVRLAGGILMSLI